MNAEELIALSDKLKRPSEPFVACGWEAIEQATEKHGPPTRLHVASDIFAQVPRFDTGEQLSLAAAACAVCGLTGMPIVENKMLPDGGVIGQWGEIGPPKLFKFTSAELRIGGGEIASLPVSFAYRQPLVVPKPALFIGVDLAVDCSTPRIVVPVSLKAAAKKQRLLDRRSNVRRRKRRAEVAKLRKKPRRLAIPGARWMTTTRAEHVGTVLLSCP